MKNVAFLVDQGIASLLDPYPASWNALPPVPQGISVSDSDDGWTITVSRRSAATFGPWLFGIGCAVIAAYTWLVPAGAGDKTGGLEKYFFTAVALIWIPGAVLGTWGSDIIQKRGSDLFIRARFWKWTQTQFITWAELRQIRLRHDRGRGGMIGGSVTRSIELISNRTIRFGSSFTDEQRAYVAQFLLQKANADNERPVS